MRIIKKMFVLSIMILFSLLINKTNRCSASELCQINRVQTLGEKVSRVHAASELCQINRVQTSREATQQLKLASELCQINELRPYVNICNFFL